MPYKSKAQQRLFHAKLAQGEISAKTVKEYDNATDFSHLPERKSKKKKRHTALEDAGRRFSKRHMKEATKED